MTTTTKPRNVLTERQLVALRSLAERTEPKDPDSYFWHINTALAFQVQDDLVKVGVADRRGHQAIGASNTLSSLRRRGFVAKGGDGCYVQARWWITPEGAEYLSSNPAAS